MRITDEQKHNRDRQLEDAILIGDLRTENARLKAELSERVDTANKIIAEKIDEIKKLKQDFEGFRSFVKEEFNYP